MNDGMNGGVIEASEYCSQAMSPLTERRVCGWVDATRWLWQRIGVSARYRYIRWLKLSQVKRRSGPLAMAKIARFYANLLRFSIIYTTRPRRLLFSFFF